jgi:disulfide oxidoreductase YuzD
MARTVTVEIVGAPIACAEGAKDAWREVAEWTAGQLASRYGNAVAVRYYDLMDVDCPTVPPHAQLPLVMVGGEVVSSGGKVSVPALRRKLDGLGVAAQ